MKIVLPIFMHTDKTLFLEDGGCDFSIKDMLLVEWPFYQVDGIGDYFKDGKQYTLIVSSGEEYISPVARCKIENIIDQQLNGLRLYMSQS